jgi:hypothetical protein
VWAVDGIRDTVVCGVGTDTVYADVGLDSISSTCEVVRTG